MWVIGWLAGCDACRAAPPPPAPPVQAVGALAGICDASAAVAVGPWLVVADDEHDVLRVFGPDLAPAPAIDLAALDPALAGAGEADLEGMTTAPDGTVWVVGSHDPGKGTAPKADRRVLFGLRLEAGPTGVVAALAGPVATDGRMLAPVAEGTAGRSAKDPLGLSIEGLAWRDGALEVGFRAPVRDGRAAVVRLAGPEPTVTWLDLGGRGIRSLEDDLVLAGGEAGFAVYRRGPEGGAVEVPVAFGDWTPEALVRRDDGWWVLSDDGRRRIDGEECRDLPEARRRARVGRLPAQAAGASAN